MIIDKKRLLELQSIQKNWVYYEDKWYNIVDVFGELYCNGSKMPDNWTSGEEIEEIEEIEVFIPIKNRFEILDL
jgi:hypothetical protein